MTFKESILQFAETAKAKAALCRNEQETKEALIEPFFQLLGYDTANPAEFASEDCAVAGGIVIGMADYGVYLDGRPSILIEAKRAGAALDNGFGQLWKYFASSEARFAVLTNGTEYRFYTDIDKAHILDDAPFLAFELPGIGDAQLGLLALFRKEAFDCNRIFEAASNAGCRRRMAEWLEKEFASPSDWFVAAAIDGFYAGNKTKNAIAKFRPLLKVALADCVSSMAARGIDAAVGELLEIGIEDSYFENVKNLLDNAGFNTKTLRRVPKGSDFLVSYRNCWLCKFGPDDSGGMALCFFRPYRELEYKRGKPEVVETAGLRSASNVSVYREKIEAAARDIDEAWGKVARLKKGPQAAADVAE